MAAEFLSCIAPPALAVIITVPVALDLNRDFAMPLISVLLDVTSSVPVSALQAIVCGSETGSPLSSTTRQLSSTSTPMTAGLSKRTY